MFCCCADGTMLPPMVVYKSTTGVVYQSWCEGGPDGTTYAATKNGWFNMDKFNQWFKQAGIYLLIQYRYGTGTVPLRTCQHFFLLLVPLPVPVLYRYL
jgi:hypothetical protein